MVNKYRLKLCEYELLDLLLFTNRSLKAFDLLQFLVKLFIISV